MSFITKKGLRALMYDTIRYGEVVDMPWSYEMSFDYDKGVFHMHCTEEVNPNDFDAQWEDVISMYEDLWSGDDFNYRRMINITFPELEYQTLDGVDFRYEPDSGVLYADDGLKVTEIRNADDFKRFMKE